MPRTATRVALLLAVLAVTAVWAIGRTRARRARTAWEQPVALAVLVLAGEVPVAGRQVATLHASLDAVAERLSEERRRHAPGARGPAFTVELVGPLRPERLPPVAAPGPGILDRALHALELWRATRAANAAAEDAGGLPAGAFDVRIYLVASPGGAGLFAEGLGESGGEVGVVRASLEGDGLLAATAVFHETLHTLGASDKYDAAGHAATGGLVEPELAPPYPQRLAEIMVGELPLGPTEGRLPASAAELGVGPVTAVELGWRGP